MNIDELKVLSDDAIIEKVAVEVMGWRTRKSKTCKWCIIFQAEDDELGYCKLCRLPSCYWNPLTDWNHTMEVVARLKKKGIDFAFASYELEPPYTATFNISRDSLVSDANPRRAICFAALRAVSFIPV